MRGQAPADLPVVLDTLLRTSQLVMDYPEIVEMDINPLVVYDQGQGGIVLDARIILAEGVPAQADGEGGVIAGELVAG